MNLFPLYKQTQTGAIQRWDISVEQVDACGVIVTRWGQVGGAIQETRDVISKGKSIGKKNATTACDQAVKEAEARWEKQKKKGYVVSVEAAAAGEIDQTSITGGISPMLAEKYSEHGDDIEWPAFCQPKLDGHRCIAIIESGHATLWTRSRKPITSVPHIVTALEQHLGHSQSRVVLDGELYLHSLGSDFERLTSLLRKKEPVPEASVVQYHVYDIPAAGAGFEERTTTLQVILRGAPGCIVPVETLRLEGETQMLAQFERYRADGYEGLMLRNAKGDYENRRSRDLQKVKEFLDSEFRILAIEEGRGKLAGHAIFRCSAGTGKEFTVKLKGDTGHLKEIFQHQADYIGRDLTVRYQNLSGDGIPRFPVGIRVLERLD